MLCAICNKEFKSITNTHVKTHGIALSEYKALYGNIFSKVQLNYHENIRPWNLGSCPVNHLFFNMDSSAMYYVLGMWFSDGFITHNRTSKVSGLSLDMRDEDIMHKVASAMKYNKKLCYCVDKRYGSTMVKLDIYGSAIYDRLNEFGCTTNKSLKIRFPDVPDAYKKDFIRGYMDGDGSVFVNSRGILEVSFTSGSLDFLNDLKEVINTSIFLDGSKVYNKKDTNCYFIRFSYKNRAEKLLEWLYDGAELFGDRKYNIYKTYINKFRRGKVVG